MYNPAILVPPMGNQNLSLFYVNYATLMQQSMKNRIYGNSTNFNSLIYCAVSMHFKNFQTQFLISQFKNTLINVQTTSNYQQSNSLNGITEITKEKYQKNSQVRNHKIQKKDQVPDQDIVLPIQKIQQKQRVLTSDESSDNKLIEFQRIKENKNSDKKFKKINKSDKIKQLPKVDLIDFANIRKDAFSRGDIQKRKNSLLARQVQNWNEMHKTRRNQKLQLRRIKY